MQVSRNLIGASLFSAVGALPVLFLPALLAAHLAEGGAAMGKVAATGAMLMAGELVTSLAAPLVLPATASRRTFLPIGLGFLAMILWSAFASGALYLLAWFGIGGFAALLQYLGTTRCLVEARPAAASQVRLSVSLLISGGCLLFVAVVGTAGPAQATLILVLVCAVLMALGFAVAGPGAHRDVPVSAERAGAGRVPMAMPYLAVASFFGIFIAFVSLLPSLALPGEAHALLGYMAVGKIVAAPVLWLIARNELRLRKALPYEATMSGLLAAGAVGVIFMPSALILIVIEVALNAAAGIILGRFSQTLNAQRARWAFSAIQVGAAVSFWMAHMIALNHVSAALMVVVVMAAFLPIVPWTFGTRTAAAGRRVSPPLR